MQPPEDPIAPRRVLGLNSGTSMDGVDVALVRFGGGEADLTLEVEASATVAFAPELVARLVRAPELSLLETTRLHREVAEVFAAAAREVVGERAFDLVGSHGQTVCHLPAGERTATLQIGDLDVLAEALEAPVVGDFRARDVAAGGEGAPLSPYLDWILWRDAPGTLVVNLGGVANLTAVAPDFQDCRAFDAGPANLPLDNLVRVATEGREGRDADGARALAGTAREDVLEVLLADPWFARPPPRSTGREKYGEGFARALLAGHPDTPLEDLLATLARFVAEALARAAREFLPAPPRSVLLAGGGARNPALLTEIARAFEGVPVVLHERCGVDTDNREAVLFALLADAARRGDPANLPAATGARGPRILGKWAGLGG